MGRANIWLKRSYIAVISVIGLLCLLLLGFTLFSHGYLHQAEEELASRTRSLCLHVMYVIAIAILLLTITGAFGIWKEKKWALIVFVVGMIMGSLFMLAVEIQGLASQPKITKELKESYLDILPLANASESTVGYMMEMQEQFQCCGVESYLDWGFDIPESCLCTKESTIPCVEAPRNSSLFESRKDGQSVMIYEGACLAHLLAHDMHYIKVGLGIMLGITLLWVLSVVLCIVILCQLDRKENVPTVVYSPEAKAGNYNTLIEAPEDT
ncbi:tetraspanin-8-like [Pholidichthys leucotaenia]